MEKQLFDWISWDELDTVEMFYEVTLKIDIGEYKAGTAFDYAAVDYEKGLLEFYDDGDEPIASFKLKLIVE